MPLSITTVPVVEGKECCRSPRPGVF
jgi:hypothetical protein